MKDLLEAAMIFCFGLAWPLSVYKSYRSRTAKGKSVFFLIVVIAGYLCGIMNKLIYGNINYVLSFYIINVVMISLDLAIYFRNRKLDKNDKK